MKNICLAVSAMLFVFSGRTPARAADTWTFAEDISLASSWPSGGMTLEDKITASLYRPRGSKLPAAVIINSSGGILPQHELYYARLLASNGVAALVIDSFTPRGVRRTSVVMGMSRGGGDCPGKC